MQTRNESHEVLISNIQDRRFQKKTCLFEEKKEENRVRNELLLSSLRQEYLNLLKEKEAAQKTISFYKFPQSDY